MIDRHKRIIAANLIIRQNEKILLSLRRNTGFRDGDYNIVGGHVEDGELVKEAATREALEEIGVKISPTDLILAHTLDDLSNIPRVQFYFLADKWEGEIKNMEPEKCSSLKWFPISSLPENLVPSTRHVFGEYLKGNIYSEFK